MLDMTKDDLDKIVNGVEYLLSYADTRPVARMMKDCGLTFDEYRLVCDIAMPAIRQQSQYRAAKQSLNYYKGVFNNQVAQLNKRIERLLGLR